MLASELFGMIEYKIPKELTVTGDLVGFLGPGTPDKIEVNRILVVLDYNTEIDTNGYDLLITHHPPLIYPEIPTYVLHSNWDIVPGGANDALADSLKLKVLDFFDMDTGIGRICSTDTTLKKLLKEISNTLKVDKLKVVEGKNQDIKKVAIISGFGLNPQYIELANDKGMDLILSGDLTHKGALIAKKSGISVIDASHTATEIPGLIRLCQLISKFGLIVEFEYPKIPWDIYDK